jgi:multiple sugar transport system permease protein
MTAIIARDAARVLEERKPRLTPQRVALHVFLSAAAILWVFPLFYAVYTSLRPYGDTANADRGYVSIGGQYDFDNYIRAWNQIDVPHFLWNTLIIVVPSVILVLFLASMVAFAVSRYSFKFNLLLLMIFTAGNLLPQQVVIVPLYRLYLLLPMVKPIAENGMWYDQPFGIIAIHVAFQLGFCTFVLSNFMKTIPKELNESAVVDGANVFRTYWSVILPLTRPALAALATLEFTWIYNDFFWGYLLMRTGSKFPITSALSNLSGQFFTDNNLLAAGSVIVALPTLIVYFALQKQFISGLTLGSTKG